MKKQIALLQRDCEIIESLNKSIPQANRNARARHEVQPRIGDYSGKRYSVTGDPLSETEFAEHLKKVLPGPDDMKVLEPIFKAGQWMTADAKAA